MGDIKRPSDEWDEREKAMDRPVRPSKRVINKVYLGYGHWIVHYEDGTKELRFVKTPEAWVEFYMADDWTDDGFPIWED